MGYGMTGHVAVGFQNSFGTANVASYHYFPIITENLIESKPPLISEAMYGRYEAGETYEGYNEITGDIVFYPHPILIGKMFKAWCGTSSSTLVTSHYQHVFKPATTDFDTLAAVPPMTIEVYRDAGSASQYYDMCCNQLSFEIAHGAIVRVTASMVGGKFSKVVKTTPSYLEGDDYTWDQTSVSLNGSAVDEITTLTVTCNNNLEAKGTLDGTKTANRVKRAGFRTVEVGGSMLFVNDTELDLYRAGTEQKAVFTITGAEVSSGYNANIEIDIPSMRYNEFTPAIGGPGLIEASFVGDAKYNSGSGTMLQLKCVNSQAAY